MKRSAFIAALFGVVGIGKAQQWKQCVLDSRVAASGVWCSEKNKPALNNQCPVCGEMAEPYIVKQYFCDSGFPTKESPDGCFPARSNAVRCKRCNAAFWQDAEK